MIVIQIKVYKVMIVYEQDPELIQILQNREDFQQSWHNQEPS